MQLPPLPAARAALFLDLDGTLIEIAPRPDAVVVPPHLPGLLARLSDRLGGAVAIVTGRGLAVARALTREPPVAYAAEHGMIIDASLLPGADIPPMPMPPTPPEAWRDATQAYAVAEGLLYEPKKYGFVLHFRSCQDKGPAATAFLQDLAQGSPFQVMPAHAAAELRPRGLDKGSAVRWLMRHAPFAGRQPIFIGDDVTDRFGIEACEELGGTGYLIPDAFPGPAAVHDWLEGIVGLRAA
ncbi:trehalose-phosphatase [Pseudoroseomonas deserti]|uniref:Trehalose 6-phosphate phosphatase n=1 Tax=Teichococcus deserti TaxID=1817963 RepID=A0A1V2GWY9_9PROT|nr:trehalose-phosphatase [Pseudoroseomonas deserti]ONG47124.1 trehalose-phosphatase [Pseudoroseomonas deserti]